MSITRERTGFTMVETLVVSFLCVMVLACVIGFSLMAQKAEHRGSLALDSLGALQAVMDQLHDDLQVLSPAQSLEPAAWLERAEDSAHRLTKLSFDIWAKRPRDGSFGRSRVTYELVLVPASTPAGSPETRVTRRVEDGAGASSVRRIPVNCTLELALHASYDVTSVTGSGIAKQWDVPGPPAAGARITGLRFLVSLRAHGQDNAGKTAAAIPVEITVVPRELVRSLRQHWIQG